MVWSCWFVSHASGSDIHLIHFHSPLDALCIHSAVNKRTFSEPSFIIQLCNACICCYFESVSLLLLRTNIIVSQLSYCC